MKKFLFPVVVIASVCFTNLLKAQTNGDYGLPIPAFGNRLQSGSGTIGLHGSAHLLPHPSLMAKSALELGIQSLPIPLLKLTR